MTNRSLRTIRTELEFLADSSVITPEQLSTFLSQLPAQTSLHAPLLSNSNSLPTPAPVQNGFASPPVNQFANTSLNEKQPNYYNPSPSPAPPPAYGAPIPTPSVATASAMYEYQPSDAGDLALQPNDRIVITEFMNADWAKGRNERTGQEGIFPRSYVNIVDEKSAVATQVKPPPTPSNYGNMPLDVSQSGGGSAVGGAGGNSKLNQNGKKFGKKLGNAAVFGAGATIGSNIVNGIF
ncbi:MAG: hypothetical protein Q9195_006984 [Heterodermia aff. obscurata]